MSFVREKIPESVQNVLKAVFLNFKWGSKVSMRATVDKDVELSKGTKICQGCSISGNIAVGRFTRLNPDSEVRGEVEIGNFCAIARNVVIQGRDHAKNKAAMQTKFYENFLDSKLGQETKGGIEIGNDVWIGTRAIILSGVSIGNGAIIGAGAVVTKDVEDYEVFGGVPAKNLGFRFDEATREKLLNISWWGWNITRIKNNKEFFELDLEEANLEDIERILN